MTNILDDVFSTSEKDVGTFMDAIKEAIAKDVDESDLERIKSGKPQGIKAPENLTEQVSGFIRIFRGWHENDYVWHISPAHSKRSWRVSIERVIYAIAKTMNETIPSRVEVKIWKPYADWDIKDITFKAINVRSEWSLSDEDMNTITIRLFEILNTLV
jgi:hypothetical protein